MTSPAVAASVSGLPERALLPAAADADFDRMARLARRVIGAPMATVTLVTSAAQIFPGASGLGAELDAARTNALSYSLCQYVVRDAAPLVVADATDASVVGEIAHNRSVTELGVRAYAGVPLRDRAGRAIGTLAVMDVVPRRWTEAELEVLDDLAAACSDQLRLRELSAHTARIDERDRIAGQLQADVVAALFRHSLHLSSARSHDTAGMVDQLSIGIEQVDAIIVRLRNAVYDVG